MNRQFKKKLLKYIEQKKREKVHSGIIKALFLRRGYSRTLTDRLFLEYYLRKFFGWGISLMLAMGLFGMLFLYSNTKDTIQARANSFFIEEIKQQFNGSAELNWSPQNEEAIGSLKISGILEHEGQAKILLIARDEEYMLFDSSLLQTVAEPETNVSVSAPISNDSVIVPTIRADKSIAPFNEPIELSIASSFFAGNFSADKLCTLWTVEESVCYGSLECCAFVEAPSEDKQWNDTLYLTIGKYGAQNSSNVSARVAYVDYNLSEEKTYSNTYVSYSVAVPIEFMQVQRTFENMCVQTCHSLDLAEDSYILKIETDTPLFIDHISYAAKGEGLNSPPELIANFSNISIEQGSRISFNLSLYFNDPQNDTLLFSYYNVSNILVTIENETAMLYTNESFLGTEFMYFSASDGEFAVTSNIFSITVVEKPKPLQIFGEGLKSLRNLIGI